MESRPDPFRTWGRQGPLASRRAFLRIAAAGTLGGLAGGLFSARAALPSDEDARIRDLIEAQRPSRLARLPADFNARVGAAHVAGRYCLTGRPFLLEGADKLLELGTRLGKFWFIPDDAARSYPFHSQWGRCRNFLELARSDYWVQLFARPFQTLLLEAQSPVENNWRNAGLGEGFYKAVEQEFYDLTAHLCQVFRTRLVTIVLQHWEGDWLLRGSGQKWNPPPDDWRERCARMRRWLSARQAGVTRARRDHAGEAKCVVAHAAEVNRVADAWDKIPTMTTEVLPGVELDLISYSAYDALSSPLTLWKAIAEIRRHARTGPLFGPGAVFLGEVGIPENEQKDRIAERWDQWLGVALAAEVKYVAHWELYCNEFARGVAPGTKTPIADPALVRGFWLVKPDGSLSESGRYLAGLWKRSQAIPASASHK